MESAQHLPDPSQGVQTGHESDIPSSDPSSPGVQVTHGFFAAGNALHHIQINRPRIDSAFAESGIQEAEYRVLAGFDEAMIRNGMGCVEQIHVVTLADIGEDSPLLAKLGKIFSPFPSILFTKSFSQSHRLPVFKPDGTLWELDELVFKTASETWDDDEEQGAEQDGEPDESGPDRSGGSEGYNGEAHGTT